MSGDVGFAYGYAGDADLAGIRPAQADERLDQLVLAVAGDAREPDDFARPHGKSRAVDERPAAGRSRW